MTLRSLRPLLLAAPMILSWSARPALAQNPPVYQYYSSVKFNGQGAVAPGIGGEGCVASAVNPSPAPDGSLLIPDGIANCTVGSSLSQTQTLSGSQSGDTFSGSAMQAATPAQVSASITTTSASPNAYAESVMFYYQDGLPAVAGQTLNLNFLVTSSITNQGLASSVLVALTSDYGTVQTTLSAPLSPAIMTMSPLEIGPSGKFAITVQVVAVQNGGAGTDSISVLLGCNLPISGITYNCDGSVWNNLPGNVCSTLNSTIANLYENAFTNMAACIYVQTGDTSLAQTVSQPSTMTYANFRTALTALETDQNDITAVTASVPAANPYPSASIQLTNPLARAMGSSPTTGIQTNGQTPCALGTVGCYDAVITISSSAPLYFRSGTIGASQYDFYTLVERQTDEAVGTASCSPSACGTNIAPADLFRYHSNGQRSFATGTNDPCTASDQTNACFSLDGVNMLQQYNNLSTGDTGDWASSCATNPLVQDLSGCPGIGNLDIAQNSEILVLDVVGYTLNLTSTVNIETSPEGLQFTVDGGSPQTAPQTLHLAPGTHSIAVAPTQAGPAGTQYSFTGWSDNGAATHNITTASNSSATFVASFATQYQLTTAASPAAGGSVTPATGQYYNSSTAVPLTATPASGYVFSGWTGPVANSGNASTTVTMSAPESVTANFTALTGITIQTTPSGLQFSVDGGAVQTAPQTLQLTPGSHTITVATTQAGSPAGTQYVFTSWSDGGAASHSITVTSTPATYTATFQTQYQLTISASPAAGGTVTPASGAFYNAGSPVDIAATPNSGYSFTNWTGSVAGATSAATFINMNAPEAVVANFVAQTGVTIQTNPEGLQFTVDGGLVQTAPQSLNLAPGQHTITVATTQPGTTGIQYVFSSWSDGGAASHTITVGSSPATYTATFQTQYQLLLSASPSADGSVTPVSGSFYNSGTSVSITATPATNFTFGSWTGTVSAVANPASASTTVTMNGPETLIANFVTFTAITIQTIPSGLQFTVDGGSPQVAPETLNLTPGQHTIAVASIQPGGVPYGAGAQFVFSGWSDGGAISHAITVGATPATYTASFLTQYLLTISASPAAGGTVTPASGVYYNASSAVSISATAASGYQFAGWTGNVASASSASTTVSMTAPETVVANFTSTVTAGLAFFPVTPCRVVDTRNANGTFGGPTMTGGSTRTFPLPSGGCNIPSTAQAYALNVTVVPAATLNYLTIWPAGQTQPYVSTLNSYTGTVVANAAIVPAGTSGAVDVYVTDSTQVILDINGYFAPPATGGLSFYPLTPCRVADTRNANGTFGGPEMSAGQTRNFPLPSGGCNIPSTAQAYSLNVTAVPAATLNYLTIWPTGQTQPYVSTLNSSTGTVVANAAIVPAGSAGSISVYTTDATNVVLDINGYFAASGSPGALYLYTVAPCRVVDTRNANGAFGGPEMTAGSTRSFTLPSGSCSIPTTAEGYSLNVTVVPPAALQYLTIWPAGETQPYVSTLNAYNGAVVANAAIVPAGSSGAVSVYVSDTTQVVLDINGYFGQ